MSGCARKNYDVINEDEQNGYSAEIIRAVLIDKIKRCGNVKVLSNIVRATFSYDVQIARAADDGGMLIALEKRSDVVRDALANMAVNNIRKQ